MTEAGLCDNATFIVSRLSVGRAKKYMAGHRRTITYWRNDLSSWRETLASCRDLAELGAKNLVLFNTEAFGGILVSVDLLRERLRAFLTLALEEYYYLDPENNFQRTSPVHAIEPLNEIDTPGWTDGAGGPITIEKIINYCYAAYEVATEEFGIEVVGPSFLGGPSDWMPVEVISQLARDKKIRVATFHMYGRSIGAQPDANGIWGTVENGIREIEAYCGDMLLDLTENGWWTVAGPYGPDGQRRYAEAHCTFQHPRVRRNYLFALNDHCPAPAELEVGKDFGLEDLNGNGKPASEYWRGTLSIAKPRPTPETPGPDYIYVLGFRKFYEKLYSGGIDVGPPVENEYGPWNKWQQQRTANNFLFEWAHIDGEGGKLVCIDFNNGNRYRWDEGWPTFQQIFYNSQR